MTSGDIQKRRSHAITGEIVGPGAASLKNSRILNTVEIFLINHVQDHDPRSQENGKGRAR